MDNEPTKRRKSPEEINLPEDISVVTSYNASDSGIPPQAATSTNKLVEGEDLSLQGWLPPTERARLSESARKKPKNAARAQDGPRN
jgi:hypothetical protein